MGRNILAALVGVAIAVAIVAVIQAVGHSLYPPPPDLDLTDPEGAARAIEALPLAALIFVVAAWELGAFGGAWVATRIALGRTPVPGLIAGGFILLSSVVTMLGIPHPVWMMVLGVVLPFPMAWIGFFVARGTPSPPAAA